LPAASAYKTEMICAGIIAGVTVLFGSGIGGFLFAFEVIARKYNKSLLLSGISSMIVAQIFVFF
jgi:CIC family chloride channel protein